MASTLLTETVGMCSNGDEKHVSDGKVYREGKEVSASYFVDCHSIVTVTMFFFLIIGNLHHSTIFSQYFERLPGSESKQSSLSLARMTLVVDEPNLNSLQPCD
mmetsp:Transcript_34940/g.79027  ORF Transcript_34940/g.79027 Transcript_34940/m.79027 type:complete len:103 (+) Transcript_34940:706-1014(+)